MTTELYQLNQLGMWQHSTELQQNVISVGFELHLNLISQMGSTI